MDYNDTYNPTTNGHRRILDPTTGQPFKPIDDINKPYDDMALPHVDTFQTIFGSAYRTYVHERWDEAMRNDRDAGRAMRRDAFLMALLQERVLSTSSLKWHIEVDNANDTYQKQVKEGLTTIIKRVPRLRRMMRMLLQALWFGRYGVQIKWHWQNISGVGKRCLCVQKHLPVNGDKIGHKFDGTPYVLIHGAESFKIPGAEITQTTVARALVLRGSWRERFLIHYSDPFDEDFFTVDQQEAIHGVGLRSVLYFMDWLRKEYIGWYIDTLERTGLGFLVWRYPAGNNQAKQEAMREARKHSRRTNLVLPYYESASGKSPGVEHTETPVAGVELVLELQRHIEEHQERLVTGQSLSTQDKATSGAEVADLRAATKAKLTQADADELGETMTGSDHQPGLVSIIKRWTFPWADFPAWFAFDVDSLEPAKKLESVERAYSMGASFAEDDVIALTGMPIPRPGQKILSQSQQGGMPGEEMPGEGEEEPWISQGEGNGEWGEDGEKGWSIIHGPRGGRWMKNKKTGEVRHAALKDLSQTSLPNSHLSRKNENFQKAEQVGFPNANVKKNYQAGELEETKEASMAGESLAAETARLWNARGEMPSEQEMHLIGGFLAPLDWIVWYDHEQHQWDYCHADDWHGEAAEQHLQARAPKGGVTIGGKFYRGGQWIPQNAAEVTTTEFETDQLQPEEHGQMKPKRLRKPKEGQPGGSPNTPSEIEEMRSWLADAGMDASNASDEEVMRAVDRHFEGGLEAFRKAGRGGIANKVAEYLQGAGKQKIASLQKLHQERQDLQMAMSAAADAWVGAKDALARYMESKKRKTVKVKAEIAKMQEDLELKGQSLDAARAQKNQAKEAAIGKVERLLDVGNPSPLQPTIPESLSDYGKASVVSGFQTISRIAKDAQRLKTREIFNDGSMVNKDRSYAQHLDDGSSILGFSKNVSPQVVAHELGHAIEVQFPGVQERCREFLEYRVAGEELKPMNSVAGSPGSYDAEESGRKDNFDRFFLENQAYYVGKSYPSSTEILSMGIEAVHTDAARFAAVDPEYCGFIMGILDGTLR